MPIGWIEWCKTLKIEWKLYFPIPRWCVSKQTTENHPGHQWMLSAIYHYQMTVKSNKIRRNGNQWMKHTVDCKLDPNWYLRNGCTWGHVKFLPVALEYRLSRKEIKYVARPDRHIYRLCFLSSRVLTTTARTAHTNKSNEKWGFPSSVDNRIFVVTWNVCFTLNIKWSFTQTVM